MAYRAFISYSHADTKRAAQLHKQWENFRIDQDLVGTPTPMGPVPETLRPIFRDRGDFSPGGSLNEATRKALEHSSALILLASPHAARSPYVDGEIKLFRQLHPDRPIIPLILSGTPGKGSDNCFPPSLAPETLAADWNKDGAQLAADKVTAALLGLAPDLVFQRAARHRRAQHVLQTVIAAVIAVALLGAGYYWVQSARQQQRLDVVADLLRQYSPIATANADAALSPDELKKALTSIVEGAAVDPRYAQALELLKAGKPEAAEPLLRASAEAAEQRAKADTQKAADAWRNLATVAGLADPKKALNAYAKVVELDPSDMTSLGSLAYFELYSWRLDDSTRDYTRLLAVAEKSDDRSRMADARRGLGTIARFRSHYKEAVDNYTASEALAGDLARKYPQNPDKQLAWARVLSDQGEAQFQWGQYPQAKATLNTALAIFQRMSKLKPADDVLQHDLAHAYGQLADVLIALGQKPEAITASQAGFDLADHWSKSKPDDLGLQKGLADSYASMGYMRVQQGLLADALDSYQKALPILQHLVDNDPDNGLWQFSLYTTGNALGDVQRDRGQFQDAITSYQASLAAVKKDIESKTGLPDLSARLSFAYTKIGDVQQEMGDTANAVQSYRTAIALDEDLAKAVPNDPYRQSSLAFDYAGLGSIYLETNNTADALTSYQAEFAAAQRLNQADPGNVNWLRDLAHAYGDLGAVKQLLGSKEEALAAYQSSLDIRIRLAKADPNDVLRQWTVASAYDDLGGAQSVLGHNDEALSAYQSGLAIRQAAIKAEPSSTVHKRSLSSSLELIGQVFMAQQKFAEAQDCFQQAFAVIDPLQKENPDNPRYLQDIAVIDTEIGWSQRQQGNNDAALASFHAAHDVATKFQQATSNGNIATQLLATLDKVIAQLESK